MVGQLGESATRLGYLSLQGAKLPSLCGYRALGCPWLLLLAVDQVGKGADQVRRGDGPVVVAFHAPCGALEGMVRALILVDRPAQE